MLMTEEISKQITEMLNESPKPLKVLLFGSYAYGTPRDDSDIDLVVVLDKEGNT